MRKKYILVHYKAPRPAVGSTQPRIQYVLGLFPLRQSGGTGDHSTSTGVEVKNAQIYASTLSYHLYSAVLN
jgi:hypothetical protein